MMAVVRFGMISFFAPFWCWSSTPRGGYLSPKVFEKSNLSLDFGGLKYTLGLAVVGERNKAPAVAGACFVSCFYSNWVRVTPTHCVFVDMPMVTQILGLTAFIAASRN
jgi:hypothetical protein